MTTADTGSSRGSVGVAPDGSFQVRFARNLPASLADVWARLVDPAALAHAWRWDDLPPSKVEWSLEATTDGTRLALAHRDLTEQPAREFALGWHMILDALRLAIDGQPTEAAWEVDDAVTAAYFGE